MCIGKMRNQHAQCPREVLYFLMDLFKYNDNQYNKVRVTRSLTSLTCVAICVDLFTVSVV